MRIVFLIVFPLLLGCSGQQRDRVVMYYDVDSLISAQQNLLTIRGARLIKQARIDSDSSEKDFVPDSLQWVNELSIFKKTDINKAMLRGLYTSSVADDTNSNLTIRTLATDSREAEVKYLKLYYLNEIKNLRKMEALWVEQNPIYISSRKLSLTFEDISEKLLLKGYKIDGTQKMILQDTVRFEVVGKLDFD